MINPKRKFMGITANIEREKINKKKDNKSAIDRTEPIK